MQFLKTLFWVLLLVAGAIFASNNADPLVVRLWGGKVMDTNLPFLMLISFLVGFLPMLLWYRANRWRLTRKLEQTERALQEQTALAKPSTPMPISPADEVIPPAAAPIAVPPGVS